MNASSQSERLFDIRKRHCYQCLWQRSMHLSVVAHFSSTRAVAAASENSQRGNISDKCRAAIEVVRSCCSLMSFLWNKSHITRRDDELQHYLSRAENMTLRHIERLQNLCAMPDSDFLELQDAGTVRHRKVQLSNLHRECITAIKAQDKPNVYWLLELATTTLPMVGHISRIGKLVLEKGHQTLKRAIKS